MNDHEAFLLDTDTGTSWVSYDEQDQAKVDAILSLNYTVEYKKILLDNHIISATKSWILTTCPCSSRRHCNAA